MDRNALKSWLKAPGTTLRWSRGEVDGYDAVELRGTELRWYHWSHDYDEGQSGEGSAVSPMDARLKGARNEIRQSTESFLQDGAPAEFHAPPPVIAKLQTLIAEGR